jgi:hypothetical protein
VLTQFEIQRNRRVLENEKAVASLNNSAMLLALACTPQLERVNVENIVRAIESICETKDVKYSLACLAGAMDIELSDLDEGSKSILKSHLIKLQSHADIQAALELNTVKRKERASVAATKKQEKLKNLDRSSLKRMNQKVSVPKARVTFNQVYEVDTRI